MDTISWYQVLPALLGGGAVGALINAAFAARRNRIQPVGRRIDVTPIFRQANGASGLRAKIAITDNGNTNTFENLFIADVQIINRGNRDLDQFPFGITLSGGDTCVHVEQIPPDRHHAIIQETTVRPQSPQSELDFTLKPFNRKDSYLLKLYIVIPEGAKDPQRIGLGSSHPVKFTEMPTVADTLTKAAEGLLLTIGPLDISASLKSSARRHITRR